MVRFKLSQEGAGTRLVLDQEGVPAAFEDHVRTNWHGLLYFVPFKKYLAADA